MTEPIRYRESFDEGCGGWTGWQAGGGGPRPLDVRDGVATTRSPWGIDFNHGPPGAGYLHLLFVLLTGIRLNSVNRITPTNRFQDDHYPLDFRDAVVRVRLRGDLDQRGSELMLLAQSELATGDRVNLVLSSQPMRVESDWTETQLHLSTRDSDWTCLGSAGALADCDRYGCGPARQVLANLNVDLILVLFPLDVVPAEPVPGDPYRQRAGKDWQADASRLPRGEVQMDWIEWTYAPDVRRRDGCEA